ILKCEPFLESGFDMKRSSQLLEVERVVPNALLKIYARLRATYPRSSWDKPIHRQFALLIAFLFLFGCETTNYVPPVTPQMANATSEKGTHVDFVKLREGRTLFVHRCIECHTLPALWHDTPKD